MNKKITIEIDLPTQDLKLLKKVHKASLLNEPDYFMLSDVPVGDEPILNNLILTGLVFTSGIAYRVSRIGKIIDKRKI